MDRVKIATGVALVCACGVLAAGGPGTLGSQGGPQATAPPFSLAVRAGRFVYLSGMMATDANRGVVPGDIRVQTRVVLDNLAALLKENRSRLSQAAAVTIYLRNAADFAAMNEVYRTYWPKNPPARTTVVANLVRSEALVEIALVASVDGAPRDVILPTGWTAASSPYSYGILCGDTLFTSGLLSRSGKDNSPIPGDMAAQTRTVLDNAGEVLKAAGMSHADVVSSRVYITDAGLFQQMNTAYRAFFPKDPPSRATVKVGLTAAPYLVEIAMVAVKTSDRGPIVTSEPGGVPGKPNPNLSAAIRAGNRLYLSGMLGATEANRGDTKAQTRGALERLGRTLEAGGFGWNDVVEGTVYLTDLRDFAVMNEVYRSFFPSRLPARATVETGLVSPEGLVEIAMTAVKRN
jgi:enamine deaminase RidA (YjgF/YER057c/UK114 family)